MRGCGSLTLTNKKKRIVLLLAQKFNRAINRPGRALLSRICKSGKGQNISVLRDSFPIAVNIWGHPRVQNNRKGDLYIPRPDIDKSARNPQTRAVAHGHRPDAMGPTMPQRYPVRFKTSPIVTRSCGRYPPQSFPRFGP